jgi:hypothetical protein
MPEAIGPGPLDISAEDLFALRDAVALLECPGLAMKVAQLIGQPVTFAMKKLPPNAMEVVHNAAGRAIEKCMDVALRSLAGQAAQGPANALHKAVAAASGAVGGAFGFAALAAELPVSTTIMLRSIADVARGEGEDLNDPQTKLECIGVFALSKNANDELGYYTIRTGLTQALRAAAAEIGTRGTVRGATPAVVEFIARVAARFGVTVSEKAAAQAVPVIGACAGAAINVAFTNEFQKLAKGHFTVRRLERKYGADPVQREYGRIKRALVC